MHALIHCIKSSIV